ncbi:alpha/beta hydrolase family protein [Planctomycetota bacterium]
MALFRPADERRYPTIIKNCRVLFDPNAAPEERNPTAQRDLQAARESVRRGYVLCKFRREDLAPDRKHNRDEGVFPLYPDYDWGTIAAWAWAYQLVLDVLDDLGYANMNQVVCTGHSRGGQTAVAAGIFDERIDVVIPCTGGYGSCGTLRIRDPEGVRGRIDYIDHVKRTVPHWFSARYLEFAGQQNKLPFDAHTLVALVAPRPLLNTNATDDEYNNTLSIEAGIRTGKLVYDWMQFGDRCRLHWRPGKHGQTEDDWRALLDFADEIFFGRKGEVDRDLSRPERTKCGLSASVAVTIRCQPAEMDIRRTFVSPMLIDTWSSAEYFD